MAFRVNSIIRCRKGLPGGTTLQAKFRVPMSDCNSVNVQDFLCWKELRDSRIQLTLSGGSRASMLSESSIIPMNSITRVGPAVLSVAIGMLRLLNESNMLVKLS